MSVKDNIEKWKDTVLTNFIKKKGASAISKVEIDHIVDWMSSPDAEKYVNRLYRISVPAALNHSHLWTERLNKKAKKLLDNERDLDGLKIIKKFNDGFSIIELDSEEDYAKEGHFMGHCVYSYFGRKSAVIFSLRDKKNEPHCTIEFDPKRKYIIQIKGKGNSDVHEKYRPYLINFLCDREALAWDKIDSYDLENIGANNLGNFLYKNTEKPLNIVFNGDMAVINQMWDSYIIESLTVKGDLLFKNFTKCRRLAKKIVVEGDLIIEEAHHMLRLSDNIRVIGDVEVIECPNLKCLGKDSEDFGGDILLSDLETYCKKPVTKGEIEVEDVPRLRRAFR